MLELELLDEEYVVFTDVEFEVDEEDVPDVLPVADVVAEVEVDDDVLVVVVLVLVLLVPPPAPAQAAPGTRMQNCSTNKPTTSIQSLFFIRTSHLTGTGTPVNGYSRECG